MKYVTNIFLQIEERARTYFERIPFVHAFLGGVGVVLFWRGVWELADRLSIHPVVSVVIGSLLLGGIGLFLHTFVGNAIIIKNVEKGKRIEQKTKQEIHSVGHSVAEEEATLATLQQKINAIEGKIDQLMQK